MYFENRCVYVDGVYSSLSLIRTPLLPNNSVLVRKMSFDEREHRHCICQTVSIIDRDPCIHSYVFTDSKYAAFVYISSSEDIPSHMTGITHGLVTQEHVPLIILFL